MPPLLDARGVAVSTRDPVALDQLEAALASLHSGRGDALTRIDEALARNPDFVAGHCLRAAAFVLSGELPPERGLAVSIGVIERCSDHANDRERRSEERRVGKECRSGWLREQ